MTQISNPDETQAEQILRMAALWRRITDAECYRLLDNTISEEEANDLPPELAMNQRISLADFVTSEEPDGAIAFPKRNRRSLPAVKVDSADLIPSERDRWNYI